MAYLDVSITLVNKLKWIGAILFCYFHLPILVKNNLITYNFLVAYDIPTNHAVKELVYLLIYLPPFIHVACRVLVLTLDVAIHIACAVFLLIVAMFCFYLTPFF